MVITNPAYPQQPDSPFSFNYDPSTIAALSANPNQPIAGSTSPTLLSPNSFKTAPQSPDSSQNNSSQSSTSLSAPQLLNFGATIGKQTTGVGSSITNAINNFGTNFGFAAGKSGSALDFASGTGNFVNAAGDSVAAGTAGATAVGANADIAGMFASAQAAQDATIAAGAGAEAGSAAGLFGGATLSGTLGAAGLGFLGGGIIASAIGGNKTGGSIGGAVGAAAGYALGGAGAAALGLELGSFAGPVGAIVGGIGGALFGSLFGGGGGTPTNADLYGANLTSTGGLEGGSEQSKNPAGFAGFGQQELTSFSGLAQNAAKQLGITFASGITVDARISTQHGGAFLSVNDGKGNDTHVPFDQNNQSSVQAAYTKALELAANASGYSDNTAIGNFVNGQVSGQGTSMNGATNIAPSIPNNPSGAQQQSDWQSFLSNYKANQNANAAPIPTS